jgi:acid phosphatase family membrane protein YuiD
MCVAQIIKMIIYMFTNKNIKKVELIKTLIWRSGGMPSSHSAIVCSLVTSTAFLEGVSSNFFILTLVFAMVVLRDSMGVRRAAGLQAKAINILGKQSAEKNGLEFNSVKEIQGHTPLETIAGGLLGILISVIFYLF